MCVCVRTHNARLAVNIETPPNPPPQTPRRPTRAVLGNGKPNTLRHTSYIYIYMLCVYIYIYIHAIYNIRYVHVYIQCIYIQYVYIYIRCMCIYIHIHIYIYILVSGLNHPEKYESRFGILLLIYGKIKNV